MLTEAVGAPGVHWCARVTARSSRATTLRWSWWWPWQAPCTHTHRVRVHRIKPHAQAVSHHASDPTLTYGTLWRAAFEGRGWYPARSVTCRLAGTHWRPPPPHATTRRCCQVARPKACTIQRKYLIHALCVEHGTTTGSTASSLSTVTASAFSVGSITVEELSTVCSCKKNTSVPIHRVPMCVPIAPSPAARCVAGHGRRIQITRLRAACRTRPRCSPQTQNGVSRRRGSRLFPEGPSTDSGFRAQRGGLLRSFRLMPTGSR